VRDREDVVGTRKAGNLYMRNLIRRPSAAGESAESGDEVLSLCLACFGVWLYTVLRVNRMGGFCFAAVGYDIPKHSLDMCHRQYNLPEESTTQLLQHSEQSLHSPISLARFDDNIARRTTCTCFAATHCMAMARTTVTH
jgi:hypothetical protein